MSLTSVYSPWLGIGTTIADRPASVPQAGFFIDLATGVLQLGFNGTYYSVNPGFSSVASIAALKAIPATLRYNGLTAEVRPSGTRWVFVATSALAGDDLLVVAPTAGTGRWVRATGSIDIALPFTFSTADAAVLLTLPAGSRFYLRQAYWEVLSALTGASGGAAAIGLSSSNMTGLTTKGDILGGASGDLRATLVTGVTAGTIGVGIDTVADLHTNALLQPASTIRFDRVANQFTAGSGYAHIIGDLVANAGA